MKKQNNNKTPILANGKIIMIRAEIHEKEMKETIIKINKTKSWFFEKIKFTKLQPDSIRKKERRIKSKKLEMKKERLQ